jgi:hypothetical protein
MQLSYHKMMFDFRSFSFWVEENKPTQIETTEGQYAWFAGLCSANRKEFKGIPIVFTDGAQWL